MISLSEFLKTKPIETPEAFSVKSEKKTAFSENSDVVESKKPFQEFLKEASQEKTPAQSVAVAVPAEITVEETPEPEDDSISSEDESEEEGLEIHLEKGESEEPAVESVKDLRVRLAEDSAEIIEKNPKQSKETVFERKESDSLEKDSIETLAVTESEETDFSSEKQKVSFRDSFFQNEEIANKEEVVSEMFSIRNEKEGVEILTENNRKEEDLLLSLGKEKNLKQIPSEKKDKEIISAKEPEKQPVPPSERIAQQPESSASVFSNAVQKEPTYQDLLKKLSSEAKRIQTPLKEKLSEKEKTESSENPKSVQLSVLHSKEKKTDSEMNMKETVQTRKETARLPEEALQIKNSKETSLPVQNTESSPRVEDRQIPLFQSLRQNRTEKSNAELSFVSNPKEVLKNNFSEILKSVRTNILENGKSQADIILHPKELGRMNIQVSLERDSLHGRIFVENENAKSVLLSDLSALHKELKDIGMELASLHVDLSGNPGFAAEKGAWQEEFGSSSAKKSSYNENSASKEVSAE
ncbi:MAG TPA: flagellar hook-length control protein FliK, partial [Leptospiraceae bacterium]|nr:flagellar hook-length control protein FliK [Leptospiraceae bacterium]